MDFQLTADQRELRKWAASLAKGAFAERAYTWAKSGEVPWEQAQTLAKYGLLGMTLPEADGGQDRSLMDALLVMEEIAKVCPHTADMFQIGNFGAIRQVAAFGSESVKRRVLPKVLSGEALISIGMSEPDAGSATTDLRTTARIRGNEVVLNGSKVFNTHAPHNTFFVVWARFGNDVASSGAVVVERGTPGFTVGREERHMSGESHAALFFDDCAVPAENVLISENGFRKLFAMFNVERLGNATRALSLAQSAFDKAVDYAKERVQFGRSIAEFQGLQWKFADMKMKLDAARLLVYRAAVNADHGVPDEMETAIAKAYTNTAAFEVAHEALQVFGGYGYTDDYPLEYIFRRVRGWMIAGGTVEILKNRIASGIFERRFDQRPS